MVRCVVGRGRRAVGSLVIFFHDFDSENKIFGQD